MSAAQGGDFHAVTGGLQRTTCDRREAVVEKQGEMLGREGRLCRNRVATAAHMRKH